MNVIHRPESAAIANDMKSHLLDWLSKTTLESAGGRVRR